MEDDDENPSSASEAESNDDEATACLCQSCAPDDEFNDFEDAIEQDIVTAFLAA